MTVPPPAPGRQIWITSTNFTPNALMTPDAFCQAARPAGVATAAAFIATSKKLASAVLVPATSYHRLDGTFVGTGTDLSVDQTSSPPLASGIWQAEDGSRRDRAVTGSR